MKKLTKKQRHEVYKKALKLLKEGDFVCHIIGGILNKDGIYNLEPYFPELFMFKDRFNNAFLSHNDFDNDNCFPYNYKKSSEKLLLRKQIVLDFCILMTK